MITSKGRKIPYTDVGITRMNCFRKGCNNKAKYQWKICAAGNLWRPICKECDIILNKLVLDFFCFENKDKMIEKYKEEINYEHIV